MDVINKYLQEDDYHLVLYKCLRRAFEDIYVKEMRKTPSIYGSKHKNQTKIHWSRDWEYPWAIINSSVKAGHKVLDCGCGGSPLLPFLARYGCQAFGVDPGINTPRQSLLNYYSQLPGKVLRKIAERNSPRDVRNDENNASFIEYELDLFNRALRLLRRPNDPWIHNSRRIRKLGLNIEYYAESLENMHFSDNFFDRVFCISVIEHLPEEIAYAGMQEMARVLKKGGLLIVTVDDNGSHVHPNLQGKYQYLIDCSGLTLFGKSDFIKPNPSDVPGTYNVVGFILQK